MTSAMTKIRDDMWPSFQQCSMDLKNWAILESSIMADREHKQVDLVLKDQQRHSDQRERDLDKLQKQMVTGDHVSTASTSFYPANIGV